MVGELDEAAFALAGRLSDDGRQLRRQSVVVDVEQIAGQVRERREALPRAGASVQAGFGRVASRRRSHETVVRQQLQVFDIYLLRRRSKRLACLI